MKKVQRTESGGRQKRAAIKEMGIKFHMKRKKKKKKKKRRRRKMHDQEENLKAAPPELERISGPVLRLVLSNLESRMHEFSSGQGKLEQPRSRFSTD